VADVTLDFPKLMNEAFYPSLHWKGRYLVEHGGAGSGKSHFIAEMFLLRIITELHHNIAIFRKVAKTLRKSCFKLISDKIHDWGLSSLFKILKSDMTITYLPNGNELWFIGMDDQEKLKSIERVTSAWMEEASEFNREDFEQIDLRLRGTNDSYFQVVLSYNPVSERLWIKPAFFDTDQHDETYIHHSTYLDNKFLDEGYKIKLNRLVERDEQLHRIYALGLWGVLKGLIYEPPIMISREQYPEEYDKEVMGVDWGFNNPTAALHLGIKDQDVYVTELFYESGYTTEMFITEFPTMGFNNAMATKTIEMICDAAEPDRIESLKQAGFNAIAAHKGAGSVQSGIDCVRTYKIYTCVENINYNREKSLYRWREKNGVSLDEPLKEDDHLMDAERYAIWTALGDPVPEMRLW